MKTPEPMQNGVTPLTRAATIGSKVRRRTYARAMKDLNNIQMRSKDALEKLTFTVDLVIYIPQTLISEKHVVGVKIGLVYLFFFRYKVINVRSIYTSSK